MTTAQRSLRRFAPAVLAASLLFAVVCDAEASCLAAWLCPSSAQQACSGDGSTGPAWQAGSEVCSYGPSVDRFPQKLDVKRLNLSCQSLPLFTPPPGAASLLLHGQVRVASQDPIPPPQLNALTAPLRI